VVFTFGNTAYIYMKMYNMDGQKAERVRYAIE
jgi:hypothetical protein